MKKSKKMFLSLALIFGFSLMTPTIASVKNIASAETITQDYYLQVVNFDKNATVGSTYTLAEGTIYELSTGDEIDQATITVRNPLNKEITDIQGNSFLVENFGVHTVEYKYNDETQVFHFTASLGKYAFKFEENAKQIIPSVMNLNIGEDKVIVLPNPKIVDEDGEEVNLPDATLKITVEDPDYISNSNLTEVDGFKTFKPNKPGIWTVKYRYVLNGGNKVLISDEREIDVNDSYNNTYNIKFPTINTPPTTADTKVKVSLPKVETVVNATTNNSMRDFYLEIKAEKIVYDENEMQTGRVDVTEQTIEGYDFTAQEDGNYVITYKVTDFFGNTVTKEITEIKDVKDRKSADVKVVAPYQATPENLDDYSHNIPTKAKSENFILPAIWAEDNVDKTLEDLTLTRTIKRGSTIVFESSENPNKELVFNLDAMELEDNQVEASLDGEYTFTKGFYTVVYIAQDKAGNKETTANFTVEIDDDFAEATPAEIKWSTEENLPTRIRLGEKLKFAGPVVKHETHTRVLTQVDYALVDNVIADQDITEDKWTAINLEDSSVYEIQVPETVEAGVKTVRIRARALAYKSQSEYIYSTINIFETQDTEPVKLVEVDMSGLGNVYKEGHDIELGKFVFEDDLINFVSLEVSAYAENGQRVSVVNGNRSVSGNQLTIENAKFFASFAGDYTVTIKATDINGSAAVYTFGVNVAEYVDQIEPHFSAPKTVHDGIIELGTVLKLPEAKIAGVDTQPQYSVNVIDSPMNFSINDYEFEAFEEGIYTIQYKATVAGEEITATFQVEVKDTIAPEIADWETIKELYFPSKVDKGYMLTIPVVGFTDSNIDRKNSKVEVRRGSYTTESFTIDEITADTKPIKLSQDAVYTIIYTIKDMAKTPNTRVYDDAVIKVGDTIAPIITVNEENGKLVEETAKIGSTIDIDLTKITATDTGKGELDKEDLEIIMRHNGIEIENRFGNDEKTKYGYKLSQAGTYTLTIRIQDEAGNWSQTTTRTINVTEAENAGVETTQIIGVVLIIVSALILAGAIVYFIISKRKADEYKGK